MEKGPSKSAFLRGGNWNNGANTGLFTLNLNNSPSNSNGNIGFRCALSPKFFAVAYLPRTNDTCISTWLRKIMKRPEWHYP